MLGDPHHPVALTRQPAHCDEHPRHDGHAPPARLHREDDEASDVSPRAMAARARKALGDELGWSG